MNKYINKGTNKHIDRVSMFVYIYTLCCQSIDTVPAKGKETQGMYINTGK